MNYKKAWEMLKVTGSKEILKQMQEIEEVLNKPKKEDIKITFDHYKYIDNKELMIEELNKFSLEEIKVLAKQKYVSITKFKNKTKEQAAEILADTLYRSYHAGDCFRNCSAHNMFKKTEK